MKQLGSLSTDLYEILYISILREMGGESRMDGEGRGEYRVWWGNLREREHWGDPGVDGRIILRSIFKK
jgi:hypothetical protein